MNRIKGKVEAYVVSTMEDNQRTSLLDNLAISVEKIEVEAEGTEESLDGRHIKDGEVVIDFCGSLLAVLNHELKVLSTKQKPSFWNVAEKVSPRDAIQMIYRLDITQSDSSRCEAWVRYALKEGTIASFLSVLSEDTRLLKEFYKPAAFVRDKAKMESAKSLISHTMSAIYFNISIDNFGANSHTVDTNINPEMPQEIAYRTASGSSVDFPSNWRRRKKTRGNSAKIVNLEDCVNNVDINSTTSKDKLQEPVENLPNTNKQRKQSTNNSELLEKTYNTDDKKSVDSYENSVDNVSSDSFHSCLNVTDGNVSNNVAIINNDCTDDSDESNPHALKISGSLTHSENSVFQRVPRHSPTYTDETIENDFEIDNKSYSNCKSDLKLNKILDVITTNFNQHVVASDNQLKENSEIHSNEKTEQNEVITEKQISESCTVTPSPHQCSMSQKAMNCNDETTLNGNSIEQPIEQNDLKENINCVDSNLEKADTNNDTDNDTKNDSIVSTKANEKENIDFDFTDYEYYAERNNENTEQEIAPTYNSSLNAQALTTDSSSLTNKTSTPTLDNTNTPTTLNYSDVYNSQKHESDEIYYKPSPEQVDNQVRGSTQLINVLKSPELEIKKNTEEYFVPGIHTNADVRSDRNNVVSPNQDICRKTSITSTPKQTFESLKGNSPSSVPHSYDKSLFRKSFRSSTMDSLNSSKVSRSYDGGKFYSDDDTMSDTCSTSDQSFSILADLGITDDFIGIKEDHFSSESFMGFSSHEELENAIATCKQLIQQAPENSQRRKDLINQLIQLRLKFHEQKEETKTEVPKGVKKILGHHFYKQRNIPSTVDCDACGGTIFTLLQTVYMCKDCGFHCHRKCLKILDKACVHNRKVTDAKYNLTICLQVGLSLQQYRCADCLKRFTLEDGCFEMRLCDYSGQQYCYDCHWNEYMVIPARVIHNWDFTKYPVSRQSKHVLQILHKKPEIDLQKLNPALFNFVDELRDVRTLREQIISMKAYLASCRIASEERLLLKLQDRQHFVDDWTAYSLQDLVDIHENYLLDDLTRKYAEFSKHIKFDCLLCQGKGFLCELCGGDDIIFPFDNHVTRCGKCGSSFHRSCFTQASCPKCERNARRKSSKLANSHNDLDAEE